MDFAPSALRGRLRLPCLRAEIGPARKINLACGQRAGLYGLDALPVTSALGGRCPGGPSLRSGKCWGQAHGQVRAGLTASASADLHHHLPDRRPGPGALAPRTAAPLLGQLSAGASCLVGSPSKHCPPWASGSHSGWTPSCPVPGALRARALRVVVGRFSTFGPLARLRPPPTGRLQTRSMPWTRASPRRAMGSSPRPRGVAPWNLPARRAYFEIFASEPTCKTLRQALPIYFGVPASLHR